MEVRLRRTLWGKIVGHHVDYKNVSLFIHVVPRPWFRRQLKPHSEKGLLHMVTGWQRAQRSKGVGGNGFGVWTPLIYLSKEDTNIRLPSVTGPWYSHCLKGGGQSFFLETLLVFITDGQFAKPKRKHSNNARCMIEPIMSETFIPCSHHLYFRGFLVVLFYRLLFHLAHPKAPNLKSSGIPHLSSPQEIVFS